MREEIVHTFEKNGYLVWSLCDFENSEEKIIGSNPDVVILDINLPGKSGFEICKYLKSRMACPILILTARDALADELRALGLGADDFLTKPCNPQRLLARVERLLKTYERMKHVLQIEALMYDVDTYHVMWNQLHVVLPETEGKILRILMVGYPEIIGRQTLLTDIWGGDQYIDENILQVNITRLRKSLDVIGLKDIVQTVRGQGYCLKVNAL